MREAAHQRLYAHVPWLRTAVETAVRVYASGISVDTSKIQEALQGIDPNDPQAIQDVMSSGVFEPAQTEEQKQALSHLETLLALIEGWVQDVVIAGIDGRMPSAQRLAETMRRRRPSGGPAEKTFATLIGLELRPRALREASALWAQVREQHRGPRWRVAPPRPHPHRRRSGRSHRPAAGGHRRARRVKELLSTAGA